MNSPQRLASHDDEHRAFAQRALLAFACVLTLTAVLVVRMIFLQVVDHDRFTTISEANRIETRPLPPPRGLIVDRNGVPLAVNAPVFSLTVVPDSVRSIDDTFATLQTLVGVTDEERAAYTKRLRNRRPQEAVPVRVRLSDEEIAILAVNEHRLPGVFVQARQVRHYPFGALLAHAVGSVRRISPDDPQRLDANYAGTEHIGRIGVERVYQRHLHGRTGTERVEADARGRVREVLDHSPPQPGGRVRLFLDVGLQQAAVDALAGRRGAIVAIEPSTGGILALVSQPGYDPDPFVTGISASAYAALRDSPDVPLFDRATRGQYAPGSTFKPFVGLAALAHGVTSWERRVRDPGYFRLPGSRRQYRDWSWKRGGGGGHGNVHLAKGIYRSSNTYFFTMAHELGINRLSPFIAQFGFGTNFAADIPDALSGVLPSPEWKRKSLDAPWYPGDTINIGIGQGFLLVTPLQLAAAVATIANRGTVVRPRMAMAVEGDSYDEPPPLPPVRGASAADFELMVQAMEAVVHRKGGYDESGTANQYIGKDMAYRMAGKSGTAQVVGIAQGQEYDEDMLDERQRKHAWFVAFAPAEAPRIALAVLVENGGGGSGVASPVARQIIDHYLGVTPGADDAVEPAAPQRPARRDATAGERLAVHRTAVPVPGLALAP